MKKRILYKVKTLFLTLLLFQVIEIYAQKNIVAISSGIAASLKTSGDKPSYIDIYDVGEDAKITGINAGIGYEKILTKKVSLSSGIYFSVKGYNRGPIKTVIRNIVTIAYYQYKDKVRLNFCEIPVGVKCYFSRKNKWSIPVELGVVNQILLQAKYSPYDYQLYDPYGDIPPGFITLKERTYNSKAKLNQAKIRSYNIGTYANAGLQYQINRIVLGLSAEVKYSLLSTSLSKNRNGSVEEFANEHFYSFGLMLKAGYNF